MFKKKVIYCIHIFCLYFKYYNNSESDIIGEFVVILSQNGGQPWTNCNRSKLIWFCILNMT